MVFLKSFSSKSSPWERKIYQVSLLGNRAKKHLRANRAEGGMGQRVTGLLVVQQLRFREETGAQGL